MDLGKEINLDPTEKTLNALAARILLVASLREGPDTERVGRIGIVTEFEGEPGKAICIAYDLKEFFLVVKAYIEMTKENARVDEEGKKKEKKEKK